MVKSVDVIIVVAVLVMVSLLFVRVPRTVACCFSPTPPAAAGHHDVRRRVTTTTTSRGNAVTITGLSEERKRWESKPIQKSENGETDLVII